MTADTIIAPTDAQLAYLKKLCDERGLPPAVVYSKKHASEVIDAILDRTWRPPEWGDDAVPF